MLLRNERAMLRWICGVNFQEHIGIDNLYCKLGIVHLDAILSRSRLRWFGHIPHGLSGIQECQTITAEGARGRGRSRKSWMDQVQEDLHYCNLMADMAVHHEKWRQKVWTATSLSNPLVRGNIDFEVHDDDDGTRVQLNLVTIQLCLCLLGDKHTSDPLETQAH